jgi:hypothetical protein
MGDGLILPFAMFAFVGVMGRIVVNVVSLKRAARRRRRAPYLKTHLAI